MADLMAVCLVVAHFLILATAVILWRAIQRLSESVSDMYSLLGAVKQEIAKDRSIAVFETRSDGTSMTLRIDGEPGK